MLLSGKTAADRPLTAAEQTNRGNLANVAALDRSGSRPRAVDQKQV